MRKFPTLAARPVSRTACDDGRVPRGDYNPNPRKNEPDAELAELFERFDGRLISPGGAAQLLGLTRATVYTLGQRGDLRTFRGPKSSRTAGGDGWAWVYVPLDDVYAYAERVGRPLQRRSNVA